ncbi:hypothetical protein FB451DRAFT_1396200 [Mycena latifolia]|nr:hypothetical protein FB451DRAFT_1396200 [Mycena latifolia]
MLRPVAPIFEAYSHLGMIYRRHGSTPEAMSAARRLIEALPKDRLPKGHEGPATFTCHLADWLAMRIPRGIHSARRPIRIPGPHGTWIWVADTDRGLGALLSRIENSHPSFIPSGWTHSTWMARKTVAYGGTLDLIGKIFRGPPMPLTVVGSWTRSGHFSLSCTVRPDATKSRIVAMTSSDLLAQYPALVHHPRPSEVSKIEKYQGRTYAHCGEGHAWLQLPDSRTPKEMARALIKANSVTPACLLCIALSEVLLPGFGAFIDYALFLWDRYGLR